MLVQDRNSSRRVFIEAWAKSRRRELLTALEQLVFDVILQHPEYHHWLDNAGILQHDFSSAGDTENPFLHMGMHIAIREQISTDRPPGTQAQFKILLGKYRDEHKLQHSMMECLGQSLWQAQVNRTMPDESAYLDCLGKLG